MTITSLKDILKTFAQSLQVQNSFPALVLVLINTLVVFPRLWPDVNWGVDNETLTVTTIYVAIILSYTLYAFNIPLIRLVEGYWLNDRPWLKAFKEYLRERQIAEYKKLFTAIATDGEGRDAAQELGIRFPSKIDDVMATSLGNAIAAFEDYPYTRYGMDAIALWPRLVPILKKEDYLEFVTEQKSHFDFMLNMTIVLLVCGIELMYLIWYQSNFITLVFAMLFIPSVIWIFYLGTINSAIEWGTSVKVAFDLHRWGLWEALHLKPVSRYKQEFNRWKKVSEFILDGSDSLNYNEVSYK
ncbi:MAG: hypothetical protein JXA21_23230 [Anaerolineae bacterium]|nr:hypothetical protein [Anaerolineae bacterium]